MKGRGIKMKEENGGRDGGRDRESMCKGRMKYVGVLCVCVRAVCVGGVSDGGSRFLIPFLQALRVTQMEDLASCSELLHGMLTEAGLSGEGPPASGDMTHLSAAVSVCSVCVCTYVRVCMCVYVCVCVVCVWCVCTQL